MTGIKPLRRRTFDALCEELGYDYRLVQVVRLTDNKVDVFHYPTIEAAGNGALVKTVHTVAP